MVEASPKTPQIAFESHSLSIPLFSSNALLMRLSKSQSLSPPKAGQVPKKPVSDTRIKCQCPHVLVCDDDSFQTMYYKLLFEGLFGAADKDATEKVDLRLELFSSGECLLERFNKSRACGCMSLFLVITDYNMGKGRLNGVETVHLLRKSGYMGPIILRSSEEKSDLIQRHPKFDSMVDTGYITRYVEKNDLKRTKAVILEIVKSNSS